MYITYIYMESYNMWCLSYNPAHLPPWLVSTNSVMDTAGQRTNNGY